MPFLFQGEHGSANDNHIKNNKYEENKILSHNLHILSKLYVIRCSVDQTNKVMYHQKITYQRFNTRIQDLDQNSSLCEDDQQYLMKLQFT